MVYFILWLPLPPGAGVGKGDDLCPIVCQPVHRGGGEVEVTIVFSEKLSA